MQRLSLLLIVYLAVCCQVSIVYGQQKFLVTLRPLEQIEAFAAMDDAGTSEYVKAASSTKEKLSLPLLATLASGGRLVGHTESGDWIIEGPETTSKSLKDSGLVKTIGFDAPSDFQEVRELVLIYDIGNRPTKEQLAESGVVILEDQQRPKAEYGYMKVASDNQEKGIPATLAEKIRGVQGVSSADANTSVIIKPVKAPERPAVRANGASVSIAESAFTNDPGWNQLWGMRSIGAPKAWSSGSKVSPNIIVAVVDTGIDYGHKDLAENMWRNSRGEVGYDFVNNDTDPNDDHAHGTHCAGTIAAVGNNGKGVVGVTWKTQLMALKFMYPTADGKATGSLYDAAKCINYAIDNGANIISNSWESSVSNSLLERTIEEAQAAGIVVVAAAGNGSNGIGLNAKISPRYPASYKFDNIISVAAINRNDELTRFSNYGADSVDLAAPGQAIYSTYPTALAPTDPYRNMNGTSMAAPHVSGAVALMLSHPQYRDLNPSQLCQALRENVRKLPGLGATASRPRRCVSEGSLNIAFLGNSVQGPSVTRGSFHSTQFSFKENRKVEKGKQIKLGQLSIEVDQLVTLHIRANSSVRIKDNGSATFAHMVTGFSPNYPAEVDVEQSLWPESLRPVTVNGTKTWVNFGSVFAVDLKPGNHTIYWYGSHRNGGGLLFGSGSMTIDAMRHSP